MRAIAICLLLALAHGAAANYEGEGTACECRRPPRRCSNAGRQTTCSVQHITISWLASEATCNPGMLCR